MRVGEYKFLLRVVHPIMSENIISIEIIAYDIPNNFQDLDGAYFDKGVLRDNCKSQPNTDDKYR